MSLGEAAIKVAEKVGGKAVGRAGDEAIPHLGAAAPKSNPSAGGLAGDNLATATEQLKNASSTKSAIPGIKNFSKSSASQTAKFLRDQYNSGQKQATKLGDAVAKALPGAEKGLMKAGVKAGARALPLLGSAVSAVCAYNAFKRGDIIGGLLNTVGAIPGPVGWIGIGAAAAWDIFHHSGYGMWEAPDGTHTYMLQSSAKDVAGVSDVDAALTDAQRAIFAFPDGPQGAVWNQHPPTAPRLDTKAVEAAVKNWLDGIAKHFAGIEQMLASSDEPYAHQYREQLKPHFTAMAALPGRAKDIMAALTAVSDNAGDAYKHVIAANQAARKQLADDGHLGDNSAAGQLGTAVQQASSGIEAANDKLANMFGDAPAAVLAASHSGAPVGSNPKKDKPSTEKPAAPAANAPAPSQAQPKQADNKETPKETPKSTGGGSTPMSTPHSGGGGGTPMGGGGSPKSGGGTPMGTNSPKSAKEPNKLVDDKDGKDAKKDKPKLSMTSRDERGTGKPAAAPAAAAAPGAAAQAQPPGAQAAHPQAKPEQSKEVDVKGKKTTFPDAKTAKMAQLLANADPNHPMSLSEAAAKAGLKPPVPGQDPGHQVSPHDARPGDLLVAGDKKYMMLGDGQFYDLDAYKVVGASEVGELGDRGGYFRLDDAGTDAGPVSGPTQDPVSYPVPGGGSQPAAPTDGSAPLSPPPNPADPSTRPVPPVGDAPVTSSGAPGMPRPGGSGPANAAATNTGIGNEVPSSQPTALDPSAIK